MERVPGSRGHLPGVELGLVGVAVDEGDDVVRRRLDAELLHLVGGPPPWAPTRDLHWAPSLHRRPRGSPSSTRWTSGPMHLRCLQVRPSDQSPRGGGWLGATKGDIRAFPDIKNTKNKSRKEDGDYPWQQLSE